MLLSACTYYYPDFRLTYCASEIMPFLVCIYYTRSGTYPSVHRVFFFRVVSLITTRHSSLVTLTASHCCVGKYADSCLFPAFFSTPALYLKMMCGRINFRTDTFSCSFVWCVSSALPYPACPSQLLLFLSTQRIHIPLTAKQSTPLKYQQQFRRDTTPTPKAINAKFCRPIARRSDRHTRYTHSEWR